MEPVRLRDEAGIDARLREDLAAAREVDVGYDVAAGVARFEAGLAAGIPMPAEPAAIGGGSVWGLGIGAAVVGTAALVWALASPSPGAAVIETPAAIAEADDVPVVATKAERAPVVVPDVVPAPIVDVSPVEPVIAPPVEKRPEPRKPSPAVVVPEAPPTDEDRLKAEMAATRAAERALATDPARALTLVRAADREFAAGMFAEDREGIAALARLQLGGDGAQAAAQAYLDAHPKGTYAERLRRAL